MVKNLQNLLFALLLTVSISSVAQIDIPYVFLHKNLDDISILKSKNEIFLSPSHLDAKSIGMGKTQMIMRDDFNGMWQNPAFLHKKRLSFEFTSAQVVIPQTTIQAVNYLMNNQNNFVTGTLVDDVNYGLKLIITAKTDEELNEGIRIYNNAVGVIDELIMKFSGPRDNQMIHGLSMYPKLQTQFGNFGFSFYNSTSMAFMILPRETLRLIGENKIPENPNRDDIENLLGVAASILTSYDIEGNYKPQSLPALYSMTLLDFVMVGGYGFSVNEKLKLGVNIKVVNRRFNTSIIDFGTVDYINENTKSGIFKPFWTATLDFGGLYYNKPTGTAFSAVFKNIIPTRSISSAVLENYTSTSISIPTDSLGNKYVGRVEDNQFIADPNGDTLIFSTLQNIDYVSLYTLRTPLLFNIGIHQKLTKNLDLSFDIVDILMQDDVYGDFVNRIRIGGEYRFLRDIFAVRAGLSEVYPTFGVGANIDIKNFLFQIDMAYAYNNLTDSPGYFVQLKLGYSKLLEEQSSVIY